MREYEEKGSWVIKNKMLRWDGRMASPGWIVVLEACTVVVEQGGWEMAILSQLRTELMCHLA